jgi:ABC-type antimicrobial peptide transport system permease subunit
VKKDIELLNSYLARADQETLVSIDDAVNTSAKTTAKIDEKGQRGTFSNTTPEMVGAKTYQGSEFQLKKSKLPFSRSFKMALHSLRAKPFRLVITMLLIISSMTLFGVAASLASYSSESGFVETFSSYNTDSLTLAKAYEYDTDNYRTIMHRFSNNEVKKISEETDISFTVPNLDFLSLMPSHYTNKSENEYNITSYTMPEISDPSILYPSWVQDNRMIQEDEATATSAGNTLVAGHYPTSGNEVAISSFFYQWATKHGWSQKTAMVDSQGQTQYIDNLISAKDFTNESEFLAKEPAFQFSRNIVNYSDNGNVKTMDYSLHDFKVVGILKSTFDLAPYAELEKLATQSTLTDEEKAQTQAYHTALIYSDALAIFGNPDFFNAVVSVGGKAYNDDYELYENLVFSFTPDQTSYHKLYRFLNNHAVFGYSHPYSNDNYQYTSETNDKTKAVDTSKGASYSSNNSAFYAFDTIDSAVSYMKTAFFWSGFATACFACLLLATFIASSITYQKRQIGILRAIGARGMDIYGIFWNEAIFLSLVGGAVGLILTGVLDAVLSKNLIAATPLVAFSIFQFSWIPATMILVLAFLTGTIASFLPCFIISKKKPIDSINDR